MSELTKNAKVDLPKVTPEDPGPGPEEGEVMYLLLNHKREKSLTGISDRV